MRVATEIDDRLIVKSDEWLDHQADEFQRLQVRELTHITFGQFLENPECYTMYALALAEGGSLQRAGYSRFERWGPMRVIKKRGGKRGH